MRRTGFDLGFSLEFLVELGWACSQAPPSLHRLLLPAPLLGSL